MTNDGATILKSIGVDNPAAKILVDMSKTQDDEFGDGTTSVTVLGTVSLIFLCIFFYYSFYLCIDFFVAAELLREAEKLIEQKIHPQTIITGWRMAAQAARTALEKSAINHAVDSVEFRKDLMNIARTTLSSKILSQHKEYDFILYI